MKIILILALTSSLLLVSCSKVRESAGVNRKNIDEFAVIENPPLVIPPDFNLLPPDQLEEKNLDKAESELAKEILFGLDDETNSKNSDLSTMENILKQSNVDDTNDSIRDEINEQFASEKRSVSKSWNDEIEILDSIAESERLRNKLLNKETESNTEIPKVKVNKNKKKKRFFFF